MLPVQLRMKDQDFEQVCVRRSGVAVYRGDGTYLRIGSGLEPELEAHRFMLEHGFPVARILAHGMHEGLPYAIEESLGDLTLGDRFEAGLADGEDMHEDGFSAFVDVV